MPTIMASNDAIDRKVLDAAEKETTGAGLQKKACVGAKEIATSVDLDPASDEDRQAQNTQQGGDTIDNGNEDRQIEEGAVGSVASHGGDDGAQAEEKEKEEATVKITASEESKEASKRFRDEHVKIGKSDRNILENPTELYLQIQHKKWDDALKQVKKNASEASEWIYRKDKKGNMMWRLLPLHASIILNAPETLVKAILSAYPRGVQCQDDLGMLPIHLAFRAGISPTIAKLLLQAYPQATEVRDFKGRRPLGLAQASSSPHRMEFLHLLKPQPVTSFTKEDLVAASAEAVAAATEEKQAAFNKQFEHMKRVYQEEIERMQTEAAKMDETNRALQESLARKADKENEESLKAIDAKIEDNSKAKECAEKQDPVDAKEAEDDFATLAAVHTKLALMEKAHKKEISGIVAEAESKEEQLEKLVIEHFKALEEVKSKMGEMEDDHKHVINRLIDEQKMKLKETQIEYEGGNSKLIKELRAKISEISAAHETEVNQIKGKFALQQAKLEAEITEERRTYQKKLNELKDSSDEKSECGATSLCGDLETVASETENKNAMKIAELETKLEALQQAKSDLEKSQLKEMKALKETATAEVNKLQKSLKNLETISSETENKNALKITELETKLEALQQAKSDLEKSQSKEMKAIKGKATAEVNKLQKSLKDIETVASETEHKNVMRIAELESNLEAQEKAKSDLEKSLLAEMKALKEKATAELDQLQRSLKELQDKAAKQSAEADAAMEDLKSQLNTLVGSKKESTQALSETLDLLESQEMHWTEENKGLNAKIEEADAALNSKNELITNLQALLDDKTKKNEKAKQSFQARESELLKTIEELEADINSMTMDLEVETAKTKLLQAEVNQLGNKSESMQATIDAEKEASEIQNEEHKKELAQLESKMRTIEVDLAAERTQTGLLQVQIHQLKDKELSMKETLKAEKETNDILTQQLEETTSKSESMQAAIDAEKEASDMQNEEHKKELAQLESKIKTMELDLAAERTQTGLLQVQIHQLKDKELSMKETLKAEKETNDILTQQLEETTNKSESMQAIFDAEKEASEIVTEEHKKELAQLESKMRTIEVDLAAERTQTGLLQVQIHQLKDKELSMKQTLEAEKETNDILEHQLEETTNMLENGPSKEAVDKFKGELEAVKSKLAEKEEEEEQTNLRIQDMLQKEIDLNKHIESLIEKMMKVKQSSKNIEAKMLRQMETLQTEKNALQGTIMVLSRSLTQQQDELELAGNESI